MVPETHRIVAGGLEGYFKSTYGVELDQSKLLRGSIAPDIYPKYKFIPHYYDESIDYIVENIVHLVPYMSEILYNTPWSKLLVHAISYKIGIISHYLCDYMTHPHARRIRCTSMQDLREHLLYERGLNRYVRSNGLDSDRVNSDASYPLFVEKEELRVMVKGKIESAVETCLEENISFANDAASAYGLNVTIMKLVCEAAYGYAVTRQVQMA